MTRRHHVLAVLVAALWGCNFVALHVSLSAFPPFLLLAMRFALVALPAIFFIRKPDVPWRTLVAIGLTMSLGQFSLMYLALRLGMPAGLASLIIQTQVIISVALGALFLGERIAREQFVGMGVGAVGLAVIAVARGVSSPLTPVILMVLAALSWSIGNILTRRAKVSGGLGITVWTGSIVPLPALALSLLLEGPGEIMHAFASWTWPAILGLAFTVYASSHIAYGVWNTLLARYEIWRVTPYALLVPVFGLASTALALHERPTAGEWCGGALLLAGVATTALVPTIRARHRRRRTNAPHDERTANAHAPLRAPQPP